jgi:hypothetical protein
MKDINSKVAPLVKGRVEVFQRFPVYGGHYDRKLYSQDNIIVESHADILAKAAAGEPVFVNGMYFAYTNGAVAEPPVPAERTASYYHTTGSVNPKGFVRVPTIAEPSFASSDTPFAHNQVTVVAVSDSNVVVPDPGNEVTDNVSQFYGAGLLFLEPSSFLNDILFSAVNFASPITKVANAQIGVRWTLTFKPVDFVPSSFSSSSSM